MTSHDHAARLSYLLALAVAANLFELILPRIPVLPWLRMGLANTFTITVVVLFSPVTAVRFALLRTVVAGLVSGVPVTTFLFSGAGGVASATLMGLAWALLGRRRRLGLIGMGVLGAVSHNLAQLCVAYLLYVRNTAFLWQIPFMIVFSLISGTVVGLLSGPVIDAFQKATICAEQPHQDRRVFTVVERGAFPVLVLAMITVFLVQRWLYFGIGYGILAMTVILSRTSPKDIAKGIFRFWGLLLWIVLANLLFTPGRYAIGGVTYEGLRQAIVHLLRLVYCISWSVVLLKLHGLDYPMLVFSKWLGGRNTLLIISGALQALPNLAAQARQMKWRTITDFKGFVKEATQARSSSVLS